jgi:hypothetical protein
MLPEGSAGSSAVVGGGGGGMWKGVDSRGVEPPMYGTYK